MDTVLLVGVFLVPVLLVTLVVWTVFRLVGTRPREVELDHILNLPPQRAIEFLLERVPPVMQPAGYRLVGQEPTRMRLSHKYRPAWVILLAIFLFPIGLLFLFISQENDLILTVSPNGAGSSRVTASGRAGAGTREELEGLLEAA